MKLKEIVSNVLTVVAVMAAGVGLASVEDNREQAFKQEMIQLQVDAERGRLDSIPNCGSLTHGATYHQRDNKSRLTNQPAHLVGERSSLHIMNRCFNQDDLDDAHARHPNRIWCFDGESGICVTYNDALWNSTEPVVTVGPTS